MATRDPFVQVDGKGIEKLDTRQALNVIVWCIRKAECQWLNRRFFTRVLKHRPYIILKWAQTADGFFAPEDNNQLWITGLEARKLVHQWRSEEDAILVGKNTAVIDNPQLNVRYAEGRAPKRVVIDRRLELKPDLNLFDQSVDTFIFNEVKTDVDGKNKYIALEDFERYVPQYILFQLYLQDIQSIIIEGGAKTLNSFIEAGLWDEARIFTGEKELKKGIKAPLIAGHVTGEYLTGKDKLKTIINQ